MAGVNIEFNADDALDALMNIESALNDLPSLFAKMGEALLDIHEARFRSQTSPDGVPWQALSPWYQASKERQQDKILTLSGELRSTLRWQIEGNSLLFGTNQPYGAIHQFGGMIKPVNSKALNVKGRVVKQVVIPARPWLGLSAKNELTLTEIVFEHLSVT